MVTSINTYYLDVNKLGIARSTNDKVYLARSIMLHGVLDCFVTE